MFHLRPLLLVLPCTFFAACQTLPPEGAADKKETRPFVPLPDEGPESIGFFLARFDQSLEEWSKLKLAASSAREQRTLEALERNMNLRATKRQEELVEVLESGAPVNRRVAAAALGFTHDPAVLGVLLARLSDSDPEVVQRALLGLGVLGRPDTPLVEIRGLLLQDKDSWTRTNAAYALLCVARAGNREPELAEACRAGCLDTEPGVRAQCASALGEMADAEALPVLKNLLHDDTNIVALAASAALACIGRKHDESKGSAARALADALDLVRDDRRLQILQALRYLSNQDLGEDARPWLEWAHRMP